MEFVNERTEVGGILYSRYIASWRNAGGKDFGEGFKDWLKSEGLTPNERREVCLMAENGKFELEESARRFLEDNRIKKLTFKKLSFK